LLLIGRGLDLKTFCSCEYGCNQCVSNCQKLFDKFIFVILYKFISEIK